MKLFKKVIVIFICINIIAFLILNVIGNKLNEERKIEQEKRIREEYKDSFLSFNNATYLFSSYKGKVRKSNITGEIEKFVTQYLPTIYENTKDLNNSNLINYYNNNKKEILSMDIATKDNFIGIVTKVKSLQEDITKYDYCDIDKDSISNENQDYLSFDFKVIYENEKSIDLKMRVINNVNLDDNLIFEFIP